MRIIFAFAVSLALGSAAPFHRERSFGIPRGGKTAKVEPPTVSADEYEKAERAIFDAVGKVEKRVQHAVEKEVDVLFHDLEDHEKEEIKAKTRSSVKKGAKAVKQQVEDHDHEKENILPLADIYPYPYEWRVEDPDVDLKILHAVESAEKAVLHAVEKEVDTLFHELKHHDEDHSGAKKAKKALKKGVANEKKKLEETNEDRRNWFTKAAKGNPLEEYMRADVEPME